MYDAGKIIAGILIFVALITVPIWLGLARGTADAEKFEPELTSELEGEKCIFDNSDGYMREAHMDILNDWRNLIVRGEIPSNEKVLERLEFPKESSGNDNYFARPLHVVTDENGSKVSYDISLTNTCIDRCHSNKDTFCDSCHIYSGVLNPNSEISGPDCWNCHYDSITTEGQISQTN